MLYLEDFKTGLGIPNVLERDIKRKWEENSCVVAVLMLRRGTTNKFMFGNLIAQIPFGGGLGYILSAVWNCHVPHWKTTYSTGNKKPQRSWILLQCKSNYIFYIQKQTADVRTSISNIPGSGWCQNLNCNTLCFHFSQQNLHPNFFSIIQLQFAQHDCNCFIYTEFMKDHV